MAVTLVTGGGGQVGRALAGADTLLLDHAALDITDANAVKAALDAHRPAAVIHCGAWTNVDACESDPDRAFLVNEAGTRNVVEAAHAVGAYVVALSTDYVFDGTKTEPYDEGDEPNPLSVYGRSKLAGEGIADATVRTSWVRGPLIEWILTTKDPLRFVTDQTSNPTIASDLATKLRWFVAQRPTGIWHVTNQGAVTAYEFARAVLEAGGADPNRVEPITTNELNRPAPRPPYSVLANQRLADSGEQLLPDFRESLKTLVRR